MKQLYTLALMILLLAPTASMADDGKMFSLYPVPLVSNTLTVKVHATVPIATFELRSLIGKKLQEKKYNGTEAEVVFTDLSQYYSGIYVVVAKDGNGKIVETMKFTINR